MATYNGEPYLRQQMDSLMSQTYTHWKLIIRDDGSSDNTVPIINSYIEKNSNITLIKNDTNIKGACTNFAALFEIAVSDKRIPYIMFCDQDDIWKPEKVARSMSAMQALEGTKGDQPALIYTNFEIMDDRDGFIPGEFKLKHSIHLNNLISYNFAFGCTMMLNRPLIEKIRSIPQQAVNQDYWIALVASAYRTSFLNEKVLRYRQHSTNTSQNYRGNNTLIERLKRNLLVPDKEIDYLKSKLAMFEAFLTIYNEQLPEHHKLLLINYLNSFRSTRLNVCYTMLKNRIFRRGFFQTLSSFAQVILFYKNITNRT
jgi:rhamnosyltransferase